MPIYLQPVILPDRCFLGEVLYWVAFQRIPLARYVLDGEYRESEEIGDYAVDLGESAVSDEETRRAGIGPDPRYAALIEGTSISPLSWIDKKLADGDLDPIYRHILEVDRTESLKFEALLQDWWPQYQSAIEYPASTIFVALKEGRLKATGRPLPHVNEEEAFTLLESEKKSVIDIKAKEVSSAFWTLQGIDFESSTAKNSTEHFCHVSVNTEDMLAAFPGRSTSTAEVQRIGDSYLLKDYPRPQAAARRGRPSYPWEQFHIEVAQLVASDELPQKKESAIEYFSSWFVKNLGVRPSRAAIGEKLKPYYDRFVKVRGQKI